MARPVEVFAAGCAGRRGALRRGWRTLKSADFVAALAAPVRARSAHFVLHHLGSTPASAARRQGTPMAADLSTELAPNRAVLVDNEPPGAQYWLGLVVPKRHAARSVTRNLLKRQMRAQASASRTRLPPGQWVIRLRAPFDVGHFPSAASQRLRAAVRDELEMVFSAAVTA